MDGKDNARRLIIQPKRLRPLTALSFFSFLGGDLRGLQSDSQIPSVLSYAKWRNDIVEYVKITKLRLAASLLAFVMGASLAYLGVAKAGQVLVVENAAHSDVIIVLCEDFTDSRAERGLKLLREGYGAKLVLEAPDRVHYGRNQAAAAEDYLQRTAPDELSRVYVCSISPDSEMREMMQLDLCIQRIAPNASSGLLVTSDYLTRRSLDTAQHTLPRYRWTIAATRKLDLSPRWWRNRESAKVVVTEWQKLVWWLVVKRWRAD